MNFNSKKYIEILNYISKNSQNSTKIVAVSKNHPLSSVELAIKNKIRIFGENRVQEALSKFQNLKIKYPEIELHLTGPLQTNKVKDAIKIFDCFQTLDREKLAKEFYKHSDKLKNKIFFIQINIGEEESKSGISKKQSGDFIHYCQQELKLKIDGLMCIPPIKESPIKYFNLLKQMAEKNNLRHLSMGMSGDYESAVACGATYIRVGTKLFGERQKKWKWHLQF